ncbi:MAG TPA: ACP S-malonyltransferase [Bacteroidia bacterium]|jgi:[acyl-carrier-protein] S-malonyltransferase|nr:ACP S-malonyltransferase [Bacteroidia bacterium]HRU18577.1 ACP S-malonyltransferase [Bacteroidia bacterium]
MSIKRAYIFPGQGSQFSGMGKDLFEQSDAARSIFEKANIITGFPITEIMFAGTDEELKQTKVTQPAIFIHSCAVIASLGENFNPDMVAGHSLGEFSALVANKCLNFEDGLKLVMERALAMQAACEKQPSTMAAILGLDDDKVEAICAGIDDVVVCANYNCPGQLVISGTVDGVKTACEQLTAAGARRALLLPVGGAFHSPLMEPARERLANAIRNTRFETPVCPVYQNVNAMPASDAVTIQKNLIEQLTAPVRWTQTVIQMVNDGAVEFVEAGPGKVLQGLVKKIHKEAQVMSA